MEASPNLAEKSIRKLYTLAMSSLITDYFQQDSKTLGKLLAKFKQLQQWNSWLKECLEQDSLLPQHCFIVSLAGTSLIVLADNPHWVTRFRFHIPALLSRLRNYSDFAMVQSICCKVQPNYEPVSPFKARGPQKKLSEENAALLRETANKITDETLRLALEKIIKHS